MARVALALPTLHTSRLRLRPFDDADARPLFGMHTSPHVLRSWDAALGRACSRGAVHRGLPEEGR
jgi:RimJ/RimL family protein N-acetyltransferase